MNNSLRNRMKDYELVSRNFLMKRQPVIIRLDGKAFHTFTKGLEKPFDKILMESMWETARYLCKNIGGCKIAYTQSDEISLLLTDYETVSTCAWFENNVQKMVSISASMATLAFNKSFNEVYNRYLQEGLVSDKMKEVYERKLYTAIFDSRAYNIPKEDVVNYFIWRQQDATRNSIQMVGRANFSHKELQNKNGNEIQELLYAEKGINFNDLPVSQKRGVCIKKERYALDMEDVLKNENRIPKKVLEKMRTEKKDIVGSKWIIDKNIPIFTKDREYIKSFL